MKPERGLLAPKKVAPVIGMSIAVTLVSAVSNAFMITGPKLASVWNSMAPSTARWTKLWALASAVAPSRRLSETSTSTRRARHCRAGLFPPAGRTRCRAADWQSRWSASTRCAADGRRRHRPPSPSADRRSAAPRRNSEGRSRGSRHGRRWQASPPSRRSGRISARCPRDGLGNSAGKLACKFRHCRPPVRGSFSRVRRWSIAPAAAVGAFSKRVSLPKVVSQATMMRSSDRLHLGDWPAEPGRQRLRTGQRQPGGARAWRAGQEHEFSPKDRADLAQAGRRTRRQPAPGADPLRQHQGGRGVSDEGELAEALHVSRPVVARGAARAADPRRGRKPAGRALHGHRSGDLAAAGAACTSSSPQRIQPRRPAPGAAGQ